MSALDVKSVKGNVSEEIKKIIMEMPRRFVIDPKGMTGFAGSVGANIKVTEVSTRPKEWASKKEEAIVVCEMEVTQDMLNGLGNMHGGCSAYVIDVCTTLPLAVISGNPGISQAINMVYHAPAPLGTPLRIVSTTMAVGGRTRSCRGEIWDTKNSRLVASGIHVKMLPSQPKL